MSERLPTLTDQRAAGLDTTLTDVIRVALRQTWRDLFYRLTPKRVRRVYRRKAKHG